SLLLPDYLTLDHRQLGGHSVKIRRCDLERILGENGKIGQHAGREETLLMRRASRRGRADREAAQRAHYVDTLLRVPPVGRDVAGSLARDGGVNAQPRVERLDRRVRPKRQGRAGILERLPSVRAGAALTPQTV